MLFSFAFAVIWTYNSIRPLSDNKNDKVVGIEIVSDYKIISRNELMVWPAGTMFEQGMAAYFYAADPEVRVEPRIEIEGMEQGFLKGNINSKIILQAVDDKSRVYWSYNMGVVPNQSIYLSKGVTEQPDQLVENARDIVLDIPAAYEIITQIGDELLFQNGIYQMMVISELKVTGTVNGTVVDKTITQILPLELQGTFFTIPKSNDVASNVSLQKSNGNPTPKNLIVEGIQGNPLPVSVTVFLFCLLMILIYIMNNDKSRAAVEHRRFKEWITEGNVEVKDRLTIHILSLEGLVDLAIDLDRRVIFDSKINKYYVLTEDIVYAYDRERPDLENDNRPQLGKLLLDRGLLRPEQLEIGIHYEKKIGSRLGESLMALGFIDEATLYSTLAAQQKMDYYELDPTVAYTDTNWIHKMSIQKAKALMAIPVGHRADGKLVIACSESGKEWVRNALQESFGSDIFLVAARPSVIYEILDRLNYQENNKKGQTDQTVLKSPYERLSREECDHFKESYYRGSIRQELILKASQAVDPIILSQVPEQEAILPWLAGKNYIKSELANLMRSLDKTIQDMDWETRHEKKLPNLIELLINANYLTRETAEWAERERIVQGLSLEQLLLQNYLVSVQTMKHALLLLNTLSSILNKTPMESLEK